MSIEKIHVGLLNLFLSTVLIYDSLTLCSQKEIPSSSDGEYNSFALLLAVEAGNREVVTLLLDKGVDINAKDNGGLTALIMAASEGHSEIIALLLKRGADINAEDKWGRIALMLASKKGHKEVVALLLDNGANLNARTDNGETALMMATKKEVIELLLEKGADINAKDNTDKTVLMDAVIIKSKELIALLLKKGADVNAKNKDGRTALIYAVQFWLRHEDSGEVIALLLEKGADINARDKWDKTVLMVAVQERMKENVELLLDKGADINAKNNDGLTALMVAASMVAVAKPASWKGYSEIIALLIERGADLNAKDKDGRTALMFAIKEGMNGSIEVQLDIGKEGMREGIGLLLDKGADINAKDKGGRIALMFASMLGHKEVVALLLERGADLNAKDKDGRTALIFACTRDNKEVVALLIERGADLNAKDKDERTAMFRAVKNGYKELVELLLDKGADFNDVSFKDSSDLVSGARIGSKQKVALLLDKGIDVNSKDNNGMTALMAAAAAGHKEMVTLLLDRGADLKANDDKYGGTALLWAAEKGHKEVIALLLDRGANINAKANNRRTALMVSVYHNRKEIIASLLDKGADINAKDQDGATALTLATKNGHKTVIALFFRADIKPLFEQNRCTTIDRTRRLLEQKLHRLSMKLKTLVLTDFTKTIGGRDFDTLSAEQAVTNTVNDLKILQKSKSKVESSFKGDKASKAITGLLVTNIDLTRITGLTNTITRSENQSIEQQAYSEDSEQKEIYSGLSIDSGLMHTLIPAILLRAIEDRYKVEVHKLFDCIGGTGFGSIVTLGLAATRDNNTRFIDSQRIVDFFYKEGPKIFLKKGKKDYYDVRKLQKTLILYFNDLNLSDTLINVVVPCTRLSPNESYTFDSEEAQKSLSYDFLMRNVIRASCADDYNFPIIAIEDIAHIKKALYRSVVPPYNPTDDVYAQLRTKAEKKDIRLLSLGASYVADSDFEKEHGFRKMNERLARELNNYKRLMPKLAVGPQKKWGDMDDARQELLDFYSQESEKLIEDNNFIRLLVESRK